MIGTNGRSENVHGVLPPGPLGALLADSVVLSDLCFQPLGVVGHHEDVSVVWQENARGVQEVLQRCRAIGQLLVAAHVHPLSVR